MKHVAAFLFWFVALWWLWLLLAGEWNAQQWVAAAAAAAVGAALGEAARAAADVRPTRGIGALARAYTVVPLVVVDFALLMWALPFRREGELRPAAASNPWTALVASYSPNAYVVQPDRLHRLVPFDRSEDPARP